MFLRLFVRKTTCCCSCTFPRLLMLLLTLLFRNRGPFSKQSSGGYTVTFSLCSPLETACPNNSGGTSSNACGTPGSAAVCQSWPNPNNPPQPFTMCEASANKVPTFAEYRAFGDKHIFPEKLCKQVKSSNTPKTCTFKAFLAPPPFFFFLASP